MQINISLIRINIMKQINQYYLKSILKLNQAEHKSSVALFLFIVRV